jgi:hypothetical protein
MTLTTEEKLAWAETLALRIVELAADPILSKHPDWNDIVTYADTLYVQLQADPKAD